MPGISCSHDLLKFGFCSVGTSLQYRPQVFRACLLHSTVNLIPGYPVTFIILLVCILYVCEKSPPYDSSTFLALSGAVVPFTASRLAPSHKSWSRLWQRRRAAIERYRNGPIELVGAFRGKHRLNYFFPHPLYWVITWHQTL